MKHHRQAAGFGAVTALIILVLLSLLASAVVSLVQTQSWSTIADVGSARALAAARTGLQWGAYRVLKGGWACTASTQTLDLTADTGFFVRVTCRKQSYNEGESAPGVPKVTWIYVVDAVACNNAACPASGASTDPAYVERALQLTLKN